MPDAQVYVLNGYSVTNCFVPFITYNSYNVLLLFCDILFYGPCLSAWLCNHVFAGIDRYLSISLVAFPLTPSFRADQD